MPAPGLEEHGSGPGKLQKGVERADVCLGHLLPRHSGPTPADVRYASQSDHFEASAKISRSANTDHAVQQMASYSIISSAVNKRA